MGQDLQKYSRAFRGPKIERYVGIDFALEAVQEARRRYARLARQSSAGSEYAAAFYVGDLRTAEVFDQLLGGGHSGFDVVSMQFTLQYLAESHETVRKLLARVSNLLRPGGRIIGSIPSSDVLCELYAGARVESGSVGTSRRKGNSLYSVRFRDEAWAEVCSGKMDLDVAFSRQWGMPYSFSLVDAVDGQEEYVVPWEALEELTEGLGLKVILDAPFPELLREYGGSSRFVANVFSKDGRNTPLTAEEEELFSLYSCFVFERV